MERELTPRPEVGEPTGRGISDARSSGLTLVRTLDKGFVVVIIHGPGCCYESIYR